MTGLRRSLFGAVATLATALLFAGMAGAAVPAKPSGPFDGPGGFQIRAGGVVPKVSIPGSIDPVRLYFRYAANRRMRVAIRINRVTGKREQTVRRIVTGRIAPGRWHRRLWDGRTRRGRLTRPGRYRVLAGPVGGPFRLLRRIRLRGHRFPVDAPHGTRGYIGKFGAPRVDGRIHEGFDVTAACGSPLVAVRAGTIIKKAYDPRLYGNYVVLKGEGERRTYKYVHLLRTAPVREGQKVRAGRRLGSVGQTGNAAGTPCHLHIEIRTGGRLLNPGPLLRAWDW